jgi:DNA mismatch repair protein MutL
VTGSGAGPRRIVILPDAVANQIAAGEVVERPASVVKELVENALDAQATSVRVVVEGGGRRRIRVSDDGTGMGREDALLSLDRHATSKIRDAADLLRIRTFGFRGEALPSIASVSELTIETWNEDTEAGTLIRSRGGRILDVGDTARQRGTTVEVRRLFFNAPARAKFLRSRAAETRAISEVVSQLALTNPGVAFSLHSDGRALLELQKAGDLATRVGEIWSPDEAATLVALRHEDGDLSIRGLVQRPDQARSGLRRAQVFVNGRPIREPRLIRAAERGYRTTIPERTRPWMFFFLDVRGDAVDVNVHPAKHEVRFRDLTAVESLVEAAVRRALSVEESAATFDPQLAGASPMLVRESPRTRDAEPAHGSAGDRPDQMALFLSGAPAATPQVEDSPSPALASEVPPPRLWQVLNTYIFAETRDGILIIDQHSAHERIMFERLMRAYGEGGQEGQRLLFPLTVRLSKAECEQVRSLSGLLDRAGFEVEEFGADTVVVRAVPNPHPYFDAERCFREMVAELTEGSELVESARNQHERIAKTFACKGSVKAGQRLNQTEMRELVDQLFATELPHHDVHGRPTIVRLSARELERKFGRT